MSDSMTESLPDRPAFNLLDEPWLLVRGLDGGVHELSIVDTLQRADRLAGLAGDVPTQVFALTRMLLAVLHRALRGPATVDEWEALWRAEQLPEQEIAVYLEAHRERFDLFHPIAPFMQVAGLRTAKGEVSELNKLIADVPNGHPFFTTRQGGDISLSYAEAARWLVHCQAFDPSGIKSGALGDDRVKSGKGYPIGVAWSGLLGGILPEGRTLRETLLLNLIPHDFGGRTRDRAVDLPVWERKPFGAAEQPSNDLIPPGPVTLFTWQSRRVRLHADHGRVNAVLICNGDRLTPQNMHTTETHTGWRRSEPQEKKHRVPLVYMPLEHSVERVIWRGLEAMLPGASRGQGAEAAPRVSATVTEWLSLLSTERLVEPTYPVRMRTVGMTYGSNSSVTEEIVDDALSIQAVLITQDAAELKGAAVSSVQAAEHAARALGFLAANLTRAAGGDPDGPRARAVESAYAALDPMFRTWLAELGPGVDPIDCQVEWHRSADTAIRRLGGDLVAAASPASWVGRTHSDRLYTTAHADSWFRKELRVALPFAYARDTVPA
jgi:CRISPR system Cascade subunit CasA